MYPKFRHLLATSVALVTMGVGSMAAAQDAGAGGCGDILIVLDRSGSMRSCRIDGMTKENMAKAALRSLITSRPTMPFGLFVFPAPGGSGSSCATGVSAVPIGPGGGPAILEYLDDLVSSGGTPTGTTMQAVQAYTGWTPGVKHHVLLITDGQPTCDDGLDSGSGQGCMGGDPMTACNGMGMCECRNPTKMFDAIDALAKMAIPTFVVGFEGMGEGSCTGSTGQAFNPETLNRAADLGLRPNTGATRYYSATNQATLNAALGNIIGQISGGDGEFGTPAPCAKDEFGNPINPGTGGGSVIGGNSGGAGRTGQGGTAGTSGPGAGGGEKKVGCGCSTATGPAGLLGIGLLLGSLPLLRRANRRRR
jgi:hypothetical protein